MALSPNARKTLSFVFALGVAGFVNCRPVVSRQGWDPQWGPLVPHESFPGDCGLCHVPARWDKLRADFSFDHEKETGYPLQGAHAQAACLRCHNDRGPVRVYVERGCGGCHPDPHTSTLGPDCTHCHDQTSWRPIGLIAEHQRTRFSLIGVHVVTPCESCHAGAPVGQFQGAPVACELCHQADLARALSPNHQSNGWTTDCQRCHVPLSWLGANIQHDFFPLTGGHASVNCTQCHTGGVFTGLSQDCYTCHTSDFQGATDHVSQNYSHTCTDCHSIAAWSPSSFNHVFPLTAGHAGLACTQCHTGGTYTGLSQDCFACHASDYQGATDHVSQNYSHTCTDCHSTSAWSPSSFNHPFPLTGGHAGLDCTQCHTGGSYTGLSQDCYTCHVSDFQGALNHTSLAFSQTCTDCHTVVNWDSTFSHRFPIAGSHNLACNACHNAGSASGFSCIDCHEHRQNEMDGKHSDVSGYIVYSTAECYRCHPNGRH